MKKTKLMLGDNMESLKKLPDNSVDSIVTDPPYALTSIRKRFGKEGSAPAQYGTDGAFQRASKGFMGKEWDAEVPTVEFWREVYRVLKPGGHILSFGGTRTYHRMVVNIEDAGFEIRDQIMWLYGSGFPKSHNIGKAVDKLEGNDREVVGDNPNHRKTAGLLELGFQDGKESSTLTKGQSQWEGWGTALKPANEPICVARKPLSEKSVAENVLKWGTGGINIDGCRVKFDDKDTNPATNPLYRHQNADKYKQVTDHGQKEGVNVAFTNSMNPPSEEGRFPANIILECLCDEVIKGEKGEPFLYKGKEYNNKELEGGRSVDFMKGSKAEAPNNYNDKGDIHTNPMCPCYLMDEQSGNLKSTGAIRKKDTETEPTSWDMNKKVGNNSNPYAGQSGGASRFFYQAKVSKAERNMGLDEFEEVKIKTNISGLDDKPREDGSIRETPSKKNTHPTVKPVSLMAYLCRLVTPPNGIVLDPFMGSGSTGIAARLEGFRFIGMEMDKEYFKIASARIENHEEYRKFIK